MTDREVICVKLDLKGLKLVWIGMLLSIIGSICNGSGSRNAVSNLTDITTSASAASAGASVLGTVGGILGIVAFILVIVGLSQLKNVSVYFKKARNLQILLLILAIVMVIVIAIGIAIVMIGGAADPDASVTAIIGVAVAAIVLVIVLVIFAILYNTNLLKGCQETAKICEDYPLAEQFRKMRRMYIIAIILIAVGAVVMIGGLIIFGVTAASGAEGTAVLIALIPGVVLIVVGGIIMLVYTILLLVRLIILSKYDGKEIPQQTAGTPQM